MRTLAADTIPGGPISDADAPVFALLCAQFGLQVEDGHWWPSSGRHRAHVPDDAPSPTSMSDPTIDLLERTLAALRAWEPYAPAEVLVSRR